jgi:quercetin dioxygenase-like cupin family protein
MTAEVAKHDLKKAHKDLRDAVNKATRDIADDARVLKVDYNGRPATYTLHRGAWVKAQGGLKMMLVDNTEDCAKDDACTCHRVKWSERNDYENNSACTRVLCSGTGNVENHSHTYTEVVQVIQGSMTERTTGRIYHPGDIIVYPANTPHQPELNGMVLICWQPPLDRHLEQFPI